MDPLIALGDDSAHPEQLRTFRGPVARRAGPVLLARDDDQRDALGAVALGRVVDRSFFARREMDGPGPFRAGDEKVAEANVRERAPNHHLVVPAA